MKHFLPSTALALLIGLGSLPLVGNAYAANSWDKLQPDRDEVVASLNVVELLKRHHYSKPPLNDARSPRTSVVETWTSRGGWPASVTYR